MVHIWYFFSVIFCILAGYICRAVLKMPYCSIIEGNKVAAETGAYQFTVTKLGTEILETKYPQSPFAFDFRTHICCSE
jgi:hypothetical protein